MTKIYGIHTYSAYLLKRNTSTAATTTTNNQTGNEFFSFKRHYYQLLFFCLIHIWVKKKIAKDKIYGIRDIRSHRLYYTQHINKKVVTNRISFSFEKKCACFSTSFVTYFPLNHLNSLFRYETSSLSFTVFLLLKQMDCNNGILCVCMQKLLEIFVQYVKAGYKPGYWFMPFCKKCSVSSVLLLVYPCFFFNCYYLIRYKKLRIH